MHKVHASVDPINDNDKIIYSLLLCVQLTKEKCLWSLSTRSAFKPKKGKKKQEITSRLIPLKIVHVVVATQQGSWERIVLTKTAKRHQVKVK